MRVTESVVIGAPQAAVWEHLADLDRYLEFMTGITRWDPDGDLSSGLGARRRMLTKVGSAEVGGLIEVVEWHPPNDLAWSSVTGVDQRGRFRLRGAGPSATRVEMRFAYGVAGAGLAGAIAERLAAGTIARHMRRSLGRLKRVVEAERNGARSSAGQVEPEPDDRETG